MSDSLDPKDLSHQAPLIMEFSRQEYQSGLPFPIPGDLPDPGIEPAFLCLLHWQADSLPLSHLGSPNISIVLSKYYNPIKPVSVTNNAFPALPCDDSI